MKKNQLPSLLSETFVGGDSVTCWDPKGFHLPQNHQPIQVLGLYKYIDNLLGNRIHVSSTSPRSWTVD